jgi:hypothetical protein
MTGASMTPPRSAYVAALLAAAICGVIDLLVAPTQLAPAIIVICTFMLSLAYPRQAWQWALIVGLGVPLTHMIASEFGYMNRHRPANLYLTYLALVPAFIGAYSAYWLRRLGARQRQDGSTGN